MRSHRVGRYVSQNELRRDYIECLLKPTRCVKARRDVRHGESPDICLLPLSMVYDTVDSDRECFLKSGIITTSEKGVEQHIRIAPWCKDPVSTKPGDWTAVEPFWLVRRTTDEDKANMRLEHFQVNYLAAIQGIGAIEGVAESVTVPVMITSRDVKAGAELILLHNDDGRKPAKQIRLA